MSDIANKLMSSSALSVDLACVFDFDAMDARWFARGAGTNSNLELQKLSAHLMPSKRSRAACYLPPGSRWVCPDDTTRP